MYLKLAILAGAVAATALPASAQAGYYGYGPGRDGCATERRENQVGGMILGGILGGIAGSNIAASGHRHDGTAVGAVVGGLLGSEMGRGGTRCRTTQYAPPPPPVGYDPYPVNAYPPPLQTEPSYGYPQPGYAPYPDDGYYNTDPDVYVRRDRKRLDDRRGRSYNDDYAGRECVDAEQITRLPDGSVVTRPVEACRTARYGDWRVRD
jgi:hypothetical protein